MDYIAAVGQMLLGYFREQSLSYKPSKIKRIRASESGDCERAISFRLMGAPRPDPDLRGHLTMMYGSIVHDLVQDLLSGRKTVAGFEPFPDFKPEQPWTSGCFSGRADGTYGRDDDFTVIEIKTMGSNALQEKDAPRPDHYSQALISAKVLNAPNIHIIYIERPTFDAILWEDEPAVSIRQWRMPTDFDKAETIMHRLSVVHTLHQRGFLSARRIGNMTQDPEKGWGACRYCHYKERCIELGDGVIRADGLSSLRSPEYAHEKSQVG